MHFFSLDPPFISCHLTIFFLQYFLSCTANSELFHLCAEVKEIGSSVNPPTFEDVISMILEDVLGTSINADSSTLSTTDGTVRRRRRALRALAALAKLASGYPKGNGRKSQAV